MKRILLFVLLAAVALLASAAAPNGSGTYYQNANGKKGSALKTALCGIIYNRTEKSYNYLWTAFFTTDVRSTGKIWDMYSNITNYTPVTSGSSYSVEGDCYNREHSFPQSWFGSNAPMYTDLHHIYPTDGKVNGMRANYPFGETNGETYKSANNFSKLGACTYPGYTGRVFEPADEYKGDFARTYFYMVTCYEEKLADWYSKNSESRATIDGSTYPAFQSWQLNMLMEWATNDPVSEKETNRNNAVYGIQNNRNPFIDYPGLEQYIWGSKKDVAFDYDDYVQPDGSSSGSGGDPDPDPGTDPNPGGSGTYKLTITAADFNGSSYASNNNEKTSQAVCTTDETKTYEVKWTSYQVMLKNGHMQWQKGAGYIYNSTDLGTITSVTVTSTAGTYTTYYGTSEQPSSSTTPGGGYFKTVVGNDDTGKTSKIEVVFTIGNGDEPIDPSFNNLTDLSVNHGSSLTLTQGTTGTPNFLTDGTVTLSSLNTEVATVDGLTITPVAVGTAMISVNTTATDTYNAGSVMFPITVNAPEGKTTAAPTQSGLLYGESFGDNTTSSARAWSDSYSVKSGVSAVYSDITGYTITDAKQSKNNSGSTASGLMSTQGTEASIIIGPLNVADYSGLTLTYQWKASSVSATYYSKAYYATSSTGTYTELIGTGTGATTFVERSYTLPASAQVGTLYLKIVWKTSNTNGFIDEVQLSGTSSATLTKTLNDYGYASYCSEYPLDFSDYESAGYSAWQVTGVSGETITFAQVTGTVKGGTGLILKGEPNETVTLHSAASETTLDGNLLVGTIVKTYAETGQYFGLKDKAFVPVAESTVPAGKALLPASLITSNEVKVLNFVFEDDATGISLMEDGRSQMEDGVIYKQGSTIVNLAGQRLDNSQFTIHNSQLKRGIYIVNGKKILK